MRTTEELKRMTETCTTNDILQLDKASGSILPIHICML